ncbi:MAG TPA: M23 family metallopeptidase, partial [Chloroflexota bacterium]|nr:M23 family metallopeptidase [Chloroflexota bacterium]
MYRRVSIQLMPVAPFGAAREHGAARAARRGLSARWAALGLALVALAVGVLLAQAWQARRLSAALESERTRAAALQQTLSGEALAAEQRRAALEQDLRAVEGEAERLYDAVRAMRTLGEQLRERVGLPGPVLEPLPELPARGAAVSIRAEPVEAPAGHSAGSGRTEALAALPPDTGPWPEALMAPAGAPGAQSPRLQQTGEAIARQWELWQRLSQAIDERLVQRTRAARPSIRPAYGKVTSGFGRRSGFWGILATHTGIDISLPIGTVVVSTADGTVTFAGTRSGYGYTVEIQHADGLLT